MRQASRITFFNATALLILLGLACEPLGEWSSRRGTITVVPERWVSAWNLVGNLDSPALWRGPEEIWAVSTAKGTHDIWVYDATDGTLLKRVGRRGDGPGGAGRPGERRRHADRTARHRTLGAGGRAPGDEQPQKQEQQRSKNRSFHIFLVD